MNNAATVGNASGLQCPPISSVVIPEDFVEVDLGQVTMIVCRGLDEVLQFGGEPNVCMTCCHRSCFASFDDAPADLAPRVSS